MAKTNVEESSSKLLSLAGDQLCCYGQTTSEFTETKHNGLHSHLTRPNKLEPH